VETLRIRQDITLQERATVDSLVGQLMSFGDGWFVEWFGGDLRRELDESDFGYLSRGTPEKLGALDKLENWCHPFQWAGRREQLATPIARRISVLLFGRVLSRVGAPCGCRACEAMGPG
jgi:hypothetical protein